MPTGGSSSEIYVRSEQSRGRLAVIENRMPAGAPGPPLHVHDFDEAFYVLEGELTFQFGDEITTAGPGKLAFAAGGVPHTLANRSEAPARYLLICAPAGFERTLARRSADRAGVEPPEWAMQPVPEVTVVGPRIGERPARSD